MYTTIVVYTYNILKEGEKMGTEEVEIPKPKPRKKAVKKEEPEVAIAVSGGIQLNPEIPEEEKKKLDSIPFVEVKPEPIIEPKKATIEYGTEDPNPVISEPPAPPKVNPHNLRNIVILCIIILIAVGLSYWAVLTLW